MKRLLIAAALLGASAAQANEGATLLRNAAAGAMAANEFCGTKFSEKRIETLVAAFANASRQNVERARQEIFIRSVAIGMTVRDDRAARAKMCSHAWNAEAEFRAE